jgi:hypothetical protein
MKGNPLTSPLYPTCEQEASVLPPPLRVNARRLPGVSRARAHALWPAAQLTISIISAILTRNQLRRSVFLLSETGWRL